jgi:hypothetical protein
MKKKKKIPIKRLKKKLWKLVSEYIRKRDKNICFTCGRYADGSGFHAGHYIPSSICGSFLRYNEKNINGQCFRCNIHLGGYGARYHQRMVQVYGQETVDELWKLKEINIPWKEADYLKAIEYYKNLIKNNELL